MTVSTIYSKTAAKPIKKKPDINKHKYYSIIALLFIVSEIVGLTLGPRLIVVFGLLLPGGIFFFPLTYFFLDIVTEVYGYSKARLLIWSNVFAQIAYGIMVYLALLFPAAHNLKDSNAFNDVMGNVPHMVLASLLAVFSSYFINAMILAKLKVISRGKNYWLRSIGSTAIAEAVFSVVWVLVFFHGSLSTHTQIWLILSQYVLKVAYEILATPFTYLIAGFLKKHDQEDRYDYNTKFNIFSLELYND